MNIFKQMYNILVPTDFSDNANNAIEYAAALAKKENAGLVLVNAYMLPYIVTTYPPTFIGDEIKQAELASHQHLRMKCNYITSELGISCDYVSEFGEPTKVILDIIGKRKPKLVVMATNGASGLKAAFIGSNTSRVISKSTIPVIAVPGGSAYHNIKQIIYATDFHESELHVLKSLLLLLGKYKPNIQITHIYDGDFMVSQKKEFDLFRLKVEEKIKYKNISYKLFHAQNVMHELGSLAKNRTADLLVMSTHSRWFLDRFLNKSLSKAIVLKTKIPTLVFHHKEFAKIVD